ncbi:hypothetical protein GF339_10675, partial [candidate division KSB3 bacterium]|nr:hypothetical protein [candidate division KSB3 bacterium]MBD3325040.1 hypothetical protein [candidate division KSB3 bacterium]
MKKMTQYTRITLVLSLLLLVGLVGCSEESQTPVTSDASIADIPGSEQYKIADSVEVSPDSVTLLAGQTIPAGTITVEVVEDEAGAYAFIVTYSTVDGWELTEAHLWVGTDLAQMPQTRSGNPKIGNFPSQSGEITGATSYTFYVPVTLAEAMCTSTPDYLIAAHAALRKPTGDGTTYQTETGWGDGERLGDRGSWATVFAVDILCESSSTDEETGGGTETAFAFGNSLALCFSSLDTDQDGRSEFQRWGWTNGPLSPGSYAFP